MCHKQTLLPRIDYEPETRFQEVSVEFAEFIAKRVLTPSRVLEGLATFIILWLHCYMVIPSGTQGTSFVLTAQPRRTLRRPEAKRVCGPGAGKCPRRTRLRGLTLLLVWV